MRAGTSWNSFCAPCRSDLGREHRHESAPCWSLRVGATLAAKTAANSRVGGIRDQGRYRISGCRRKKARMRGRGVVDGAGTCVRLAIGRAGGHASVETIPVGVAGQGGASGATVKRKSEGQLAKHHLRNPVVGGGGDAAIQHILRWPHRLDGHVPDGGYAGQRRRWTQFPHRVAT